MIIVLWVLVGVVCNMVLGAAVWVAVDDTDQQIYRWYKSCPSQVSWILQPLVLMAWPVGLWFWLKKRKLV
jgi:ABC-type cobalamin transport system permease subunit